MNPDPYGVPTGYVPRLPEAKFIARFPPGYDIRTRTMLISENRVVLAHPDQPTLVLTADGRRERLPAITAPRP